MSDPTNILVVDDSKVSRMLISNFIKDQRPDWNISEAANAEEALQVADNTNFRYSTVDINMPGMDGIELTQHFREKHPQLHVCLLSANIQAASQQRAKELGAGFVKKPITEQCINDAIDFFESAE